MNTTNHRALGACCALAVALGSSALAGCARPTAAATPPSVWRSRQGPSS